MIGTTLKFKSIKRIKFSATDVVMLFVLLSFIIGYIIGVVLIANGNKVFDTLAANRFKNTIHIIGEVGFWSNTFNSFLLLLPFLLASYLFGTCILGCALIPAVCVIKGIFEGAFVSYVYNTYSLSGMGFSSLVIAPYLIFSSFILLLASRESICFSDRVLKNSLPRGTAINLSDDYRVFTIRYAFMLLISIIAAIINTAFTNLFFDYFKF